MGIYFFLWTKAAKALTNNKKNPELFNIWFKPLTTTGVWFVLSVLVGQNRVTHFFITTFLILLFSQNSHSYEGLSSTKNFLLNQLQSGFLYILMGT